MDNDVLIMILYVLVIFLQLGMIDKNHEVKDLKQRIEQLEAK